MSYLAQKSKGNRTHNCEPRHIPLTHAIGNRLGLTAKRAMS